MKLICNNFFENIIYKLSRARIFLLLLLLFPHISMAKGANWGYSSDSNYPHPVIKYDGNMDNHLIPSIQNKKFRHLSKLNDFTRKYYAVSVDDFISSDIFMIDDFTLSADTITSDDFLPEVNVNCSLNTNFNRPQIKYDFNIDKHPILPVNDKKFVSLNEQSDITQNALVSPKIYESPILKEINSLHSDVLWMLLIDGNCQCWGPLCFEEEEKGYLNASSNAFRYIFDPINIRKPLNSDYYLKIHKKILDNVNIDGWGDMNLKDYRVDSVADVNKSLRTQFALFDKNMSEEGWNEYLKKQNSKWISDRIVYQNEAECTFYKDRYDVIYYPSGNGRLKYQDSMGFTGYLDRNKVKKLIADPDNMEKHFMCPSFYSNNEAKNKVDIIFKEYYTKLDEINNKGFADGSKLPQNASKKDKKLEVIVRICQNLDQLHAFRDGNIRTIGLVLQRMLVENGLKPTVFNDPNCLDMKSIGEIMEAVKHGQQTYDKLLEISNMLYKKGVVSDKSKSLGDINKTFQDYIEQSKLFVYNPQNW